MEARPIGETKKQMPDWLRELIQVLLSWLLGRITKGV